MRVLIACFPKSGSTFLTELIGGLPDFKIESYVPVHERREHEMCEHAIAACTGVNQVAQLHVRAHHHSAGLIERFEMVPIVLVRNIFDAAVSLADHTAHTDPAYPMAWFNRHHADLPQADRILAVVDLALPWYFNFYLSWWHWRPDAFVTYEDIVLGDWRRKAEYLRSRGIPATDEDVQRALRRIKPGETRLNVGRAGRGAELIDAPTQERVRALTRHYPGVDFSPIGL